MDMCSDISPCVTDLVKEGKVMQDFVRLEVDSNCSTAPGSPEIHSVEPPVVDEDLIGAVIIFDWDDTLLPTSFLTGKLSGKKRASAAALKKHAQLVENTLRSASKVARVSIVTLSRNGWVYSSAAKHLRGLDFPALVAELGITIYHAFDWATDYDWENEDYVAVKQRAMVRCLKDWRSADAVLRSASRLNVLSVGDGEAEKWALKGIKGPWVKRAGLSSERPLCKTLKLMDYPTVDQLGQELMALIPGIPSLVASNRRFDLNISNPVQLASKICDVGF